MFMELFTHWLLFCASHTALKMTEANIKYSSLSTNDPENCVVKWKFIIIVMVMLPRTADSAFFVDANRLSPDGSAQY